MPELPGRSRSILKHCKLTGANCQKIPLGVCWNDWADDTEQFTKFTGNDPDLLTMPGFHGGGSRHGTRERSQPKV